MNLGSLHRCFVHLAGISLVAFGLAVRLPAATTGAFTNPLIADGADPWVIFKDGYYYYTQTTGLGVTVRKSPTITGLGAATAVTVFTPSAPNNQDVWAPELHFLNGKWYIYFAADDGNNAQHRLYVAEANTANPQGAYTAKGKLYDASDDRWAIDGTVLQTSDGSLYCIWSGWPAAANVVQNIYIAPMSNAWTISGPRVLLSTPTLSWETTPNPGAPLINEGPEAIQRNGKIFVIYSANKSWLDYYCLGMLVNTNGNVLNTNAWTKYPSPVFAGTADETGSVYSPGHCSFTRNSAQTEDWIVYHAAWYSGAGFSRSVRAEAFSWNADDTPFFAQPIPTNLPAIFPAGEAPATPTSPNVTNGFIQLEVYAAIPGTSLPELTNHVKFPAHPDLTRYAGQFELPPGLGDNYGARLSGYLIPPTTGSYVFYLCSTHQGALYLSTNAAPANKRLIATEPQWNPARTWTGTNLRPNLENISAPISLVAGHSYYVEALMKTATGADNLGVAWRMPGGQIPANGSAPIPGAYLAIPFDSTQTTAPLVGRQPTNQVRYTGMTANFSATAVSTVTPSYQWQKEVATNDWRNIVGGYTNALSLAGVQTTDGLNYRVVIRNQAGLVASDPALLKVLDLPKLAPGLSPTSHTFEVTFNASPGFTYTLQATTNFADWQSLVTTSNVTGSTRFSGSIISAYSSRSYRLNIAP